MMAPYFGSPRSASATPQRRKKYQPFAAGSVGSLSGGLAPLPAMGTSEPTTPMPAPVGIAGGGGIAGAPQQAQQWQPPWRAQAQEQAPLPRGGYQTGARAGPGQFQGQVAGQAPAALQSRTPLGGQMGGGPGARAYEQYAPGQGTDVAAQTAEQAMGLSPRGFEALDPYFASYLQLKSEREALGLQQGRSEQALEAVTQTPEQQAAAQPVDIQQTLYGESQADPYWGGRSTNLKRVKSGEVRARFEGARQQLMDASRRGAPQAWVNRKLAQLTQQQRSAELQEFATIDREISEQQRTGREREAAMQLQQYGTAGPLQQRAGAMQAQIQQDWPIAGVNYTGFEGYLRGARRDEQAMMQGLLGAQAGGGGGGGGGVAGRTFGPVGGDTSGFGGIPFGGGVARAPRPTNQYLGPGGSAAGGTGMVTSEQSWGGPEDMYSRARRLPRRLL